MKCAALALTVLLYSQHAHAAAINLGSAGTFAVLGGSTVTNTGISNIIGNVGVWPGTAITGFPPGVITGGVMHAGDAVAMQAEMDLASAYNLAAAQACTANLTGQNLGGLTLMSGVYCFNSSAQLTGTLTLDANANPGAQFIFQVSSALTSASSSSVVFLNGGNGSQVFWQVGSSATLGTQTAFQGNILALTSITLNTGAHIGCGRALAQNGAVTLDTNDISTADVDCTVTSTAATPEPGTASLLGLVSLTGLALYGASKAKTLVNHRSA